MREKITWKAVYRDGCELCQYNEDGSHNKYADIDRNKLKCVKVFLNGRLLFIRHFEGSRRLIMRYRVRKQLETNSEKERFLLLGWQDTINGVNVQDISCVFEDGHIENFGAWREDAAFSEVILTDFEKGDSNEEKVKP